MNDPSEVRVSEIPPEDRLVCEDCGNSHPLIMFKCFKTVMRNGRKEEETYLSQWCINCRRSYAEQKRIKGKTRTNGGSYWDRRHKAQEGRVDKDGLEH